MGPSQPPFCRPGRSSAGAASAIWKSCDTASLVTIVAWTSRATSAAASHAGNSPSDAETATAPARRMGATTRRALKGRDGATRGEETAGGTTRGRDVRARHRRSSREGTAGDLHGVFAFGVERAVALARGSDARCK